MGAFKAYDIRGMWNRDLNVDLVYRIGRHLPELLDAKRVLVGRDARLSSPEARDALVRGLTDSGCDVDDIGLATTPMVYHFTADGDYDASVQITASHNPPSHNGLKISRRGSLPVGYHSGLDELERRVLSGNLPPLASEAGVCQESEKVANFVAFLRRWQPDLNGLRFGIDCSNGMAALFAHDLFGSNALYINDTLDGTFPGHPPNPLEVANCAQLIELVKKERLAGGVIFDGDADRVMFIDERGEFIQPDLLIPLIAAPFLRSEPGAKVIHDIRTSRGAIEALRAAGAEPVIGRVGHAFAKVLLRESGAVCGGELAGHYYFRDFHSCDSGELAALIMLGELATAHRDGKTFSDLTAPLRRYATSGEVNYHIEKKDEAMTAVAALSRASETPLAEYDFDGIRLEFKEWWFNIRPSNTEPYLRLVVEASTPEILTSWRSRIEATLTSFMS